VFGFVLGQTVVPAGATCYCGPALPEGETDCWVPLCSKYYCPTCNKAGSPISLSDGNTYITQQDIRIPGLGNGLTLVRTWNSLPRASLQGVGLFGPNWRSTYEERIYVDDDNTVAYAQGDGTVWNFVSSGQTFAPVAPANSGATLFQGSTSWTLTFKNGEQRIFDATSGNLLSIIDRNGKTTIYLNTAPASFANPDSFRSGIPVLTSTLHQQAVNTAVGTFTVVFANTISSTSAFTINGTTFRLGQTKQAFRATVTGQRNATPPPNAHFGGYAVGVGEE